MLRIHTVSNVRNCFYGKIISDERLLRLSQSSWASYSIMFGSVTQQCSQVLFLNQFHFFNQMFSPLMFCEKALFLFAPNP